MKDLGIILRLGRNSLRESEYSCFPLFVSGIPPLALSMLSLKQ